MLTRYSPLPGVLGSNLQSRIRFDHQYRLLSNFQESQYWVHGNHRFVRRPRNMGRPFSDRLLVSIYNIGCLIGAMINIFTGERFGRKKAIWAAMGFISVGAVLQCSAFSVRSTSTDDSEGGTDDRVGWSAHGWQNDHRNR